MTMQLNFSQQDILGTFLAFFLFVFIFLFPGYVLGWLLNLFNFRKRLPWVRYLLGIVLSNAFSPIIFFLTYRFLGTFITFSLIIMFAVVWIAIEALQPRNRLVLKLSDKNKYIQRIACLIGATWVISSIFLLVDLQFGQRL